MDYYVDRFNVQREEVKGSERDEREKGKKGKKANEEKGREGEVKRCYGIEARLTLLFWVGRASFTIGVYPSHSHALFTPTTLLSPVVLLPMEDLIRHSRAIEKSQKKLEDELSSSLDDLSASLEQTKNEITQGKT